MLSPLCRKRSTQPRKRPFGEASSRQTRVSSLPSCLGWARKQSFWCVSPKTPNRPTSLGFLHELVNLTLVFGGAQTRTPTVDFLASSEADYRPPTSGRGSPRPWRNEGTMSHPTLSTPAHQLVCRFGGPGDAPSTRRAVQQRADATAVVCSSRQRPSAQSRQVRRRPDKFSHKGGARADRSCLQGGMQSTHAGTVHH